jgi:tetraacyldisaccharide 4'-kinase
MSARASIPPHLAIHRLWRRELPPRYRPLWAALTPAAGIYATVLAVRERWWRVMACAADVATISIGNLTVGGNAKTPFTLFLASRLSERGYRVGVVSRGYGRAFSTARAALVSDGKHIFLNAREAGDEPVMMARTLAGPVAVARRRLDGISLLRKSAPIDIVLLDDGFQHLRLRRNLDLLLVGESRGFGNGWVLPAGPLRERLSAIKRADAVVLVASGEAGVSALTRADRALLESKNVMRAALSARSLVRSEQGEWRETEIALAGRRVATVSGLADSAGFHAMVRALGARVTTMLDYPDHYDYGPGDWENIGQAARGAELVLTTEKDLVKLERFSLTGVPLYALRVEIVMEEPDEERLLAMVTECAPGFSTRPALPRRPANSI